MENIFLTSLTTPEVREIFRQELASYFNDERHESNTSDNEKPITVKELCKFLNITEPTLIRWRKKGKIPFIQIGSRILFQKSKVIAAIEKNKILTSK